MTENETFTAWNGDDYPWPPPSDWYLATDGRWWPTPDEHELALHAEKGQRLEVEIPPATPNSIPDNPTPTEARDIGDTFHSTKRRVPGRLPLILGVVLVAVAFGFVAALSSSAPETPVEEAAVQSPTPASRAQQEPALPSPVPGQRIEGVTPCPESDGTSERTTIFADAPPVCIDSTKSYRAEIETSQGRIVVDLDAASAPIAVNNFVVLARYQFYDGVWFHRIISRFVIQGGDANGDPLGSGGPGYAFPDELPEAGAYSVGSIAMANSGPNTNGSQFFIVTGDQGTEIPPQYTLFGQVIEGLDVVAALEATPTREGDSPTERAIIERIRIIES